MSRIGVIVCEAMFDRRVATTLTERKLHEIDPDEGLDWLPVEGRPFLKWSDMTQVLKNLRLRPRHGLFGRKPKEPDAQAARNALQIVRELSKKTQIDAILLIRDADDQPRRRIGLEQARDEAQLHAAVVIGLANPMLEAWILGGFEPESDDEEGRLAEEKRKLGFDPRRDAHRLDAKNETAKKSAKRVLDALTQGDESRKERCYEVSALELLATRGVQTGLSAFLDEVETRICKLPSA